MKSTIYTALLFIISWNVAKGQISDQQLKVILKTEIDSFKKPFDNSKYNRTSLLLQEIGLFQNWGTLIKTAEASNDNEVVKMGEELRHKVASLQVVEFPILRKKYAQYLGDALSGDGVKVKTSSNDNSILALVNPSFTIQYIMESHDILIKSLPLFRFKQLRYCQDDYYNQYSTYLIDSSPDSKVIGKGVDEIVIGSK